MITLVKDIKEANGITHNGTMHADEVFSTAFPSSEQPENKAIERPKTINILYFINFSSFI